MSNRHARQSELETALPPIPLASEDILSASIDIDPQLLDFEFISESFCPDAHPARMGVARALQDFDGTQAVRIAEHHLETLLRVAPTEKLELAMSHSLVAETYDEVGDSNSALPHWKAAVAAMRTCAPDQKLLKAEMLCGLAACQVTEGEVSQGRASFNHARRIYRALEKSESSIPRVVVDKLLDFGEALRGAGEIDVAKGIFLQAYRLAERHEGSMRRTGQHALIGVGRCHLDAEQPDRAQEVFQKVVVNVVGTELPGSDLYFYAHAGLAEAGLSMHYGEWNGAIVSLNCALNGLDRSRREQFATAAHLSLLAGRACYEMGGPADMSDGIGYLEKCLSFAARSRDNPRVLMIEALKLLVPSLHEQGHGKREGQALAQQLTLCEQHYGSEHEETVAVRRARVDYFRSVRRWPEAIEEVELVAAHAYKKFGGTSPQHIEALRDCAWTYSDAGRLDDALGRLWTARRIVSALPASEERLMIGLHADAAVILERGSRDREAVKEARRGLLLALKFYGESHPTVAETHIGMARALAAVEKPRAAWPHVRSALKFLFEQNPVDEGAVGRAFHMRAVLSHGLRDFDASLRDFGRAERHYKKAGGDTEELFLLERDRAMCICDRAEFFGVRQEREGTLEYLKRTISEAAQQGFEESEPILDLLQLATRFSTELGDMHEAAIHTSSYRRIEARLKSPLI